MKFIFCDYSQDFVDAIRKLKLEYDDIEFEYIRDDIRNVQSQAYISPSNSLLRFAGGIDYYYAQMFPTLQKLAKQYNKKVPVGNTVTIKVTNDQYMICSPTMESPGTYIADTDNVYHAMNASLHAIKNNDLHTVVCPGLGTGVGGMSVEQSAKQIKRAFDHFYKK